MNEAIKNYVLKIWLTALLLSPLLVLMIEREFPGNIISLLILACYTLIFSGLFSIPSALLLYIAVAVICENTTWSVRTSKIFWSGIALVLSALPFVFLAYMIGFSKDMISLVPCYAAGIIAGIWLYKFPRTDIEPEAWKEQ